MKIFVLAFAVIITASSVKVDVGVDWSLCDLEKFHQFEYLAETRGVVQALDAITTTSSKEVDDKLYDALKEAKYFAPKAKLYASLQPKLIPCETFVSNGKESSCELSEVKPNSELSDVYEFDHIVGEGKPEYFLYSTLSSSKLPRMLKELKGKGFVFRPLTLLHGCKNLVDWVDLSGSAVVEYEAKNPAKKSKFKPTLPSYLDHFTPKDFTIDYSLELSSIAEIALKMSQVLMDSSDPAKALRFVSANYPTLQKGLNAVKLRKDFVQAVEVQQRNFGATMNHIRINGFDLNGDTLDYYRLLGFTLALQKFTQTTSVESEELIKLVQKQQQAGNEIVYDLDLSETFFFNDLERDPQYSKWPASFSALLVNQQPHMQSPFKFIRRNLFTLVTFVPLNHPQVFEVVDDLHRTVKQQIPLRIGFQFVAPREVDELPLRVYRKLQRTNVQLAVKFLMGIKHEKLACADALKKCDVTMTCEEYAQDEALPKYAKRFNKLTSWSNGKMATGDSMNDLLSGLGFRYQNELLLFIKAWQSGQLTDSTNISDFLFDNERYTVLKEWIPEISSADELLYVEDKSGLWCPEGCEQKSEDEYFYYNGRKVQKNPSVEQDVLIDTLKKYEDAVAGKDPKVNKELQKLLKTVKTDLNPILQAPGVVVNREWTHNPQLTINIGKSKAPLKLECYLNPNTKGFPRLVLLLNKLAEVGFVSGQVTLNPSLKVIDYMYRDFYSLGEPPELVPEDLGVAVKLDGPASWITTVKESNVDPDNILGSGKVVFEVRHLVFEGQYVEKEKSGPAQGVQLELKQKNDLMTKHTEKTLVMAIHGYFQFKCQPSVYELTSPFEKSAHEIVIRSFSVPTTIIKAELPKDWYKQMLTALAEDDEEAEKGVVNVFSIASGEPYERLLRIMMTSVSQQKKGGNRLKFWLFDSFVSPSFRTSIQKLSKALGFEYEFISYKWPTWLLTQKSKMRTVWAYKILFLDVIFPRNVGRVIFVDADQVARADLTELAELNMDEQVYGFVPFCEDRPDMSSYRFWNTPGSYWEQLLQGKPYYIR